MLKTTRARSLTAALQAALEGMDMETWLELLGRRGTAMAEFDAAHQAASPRDRETCRDDIAALQAEDQVLQEMSENLLEKLAGEFRGQLGSSHHAMVPGDADCRQGCLDRKA